MPWTETDQKKKEARMKASDAVMAERHRMFDLQAKDNTMKYERPRFAVVMSSKEYRENYDLIDWSK
jgi:hypothetical protein